MKGFNRYLITGLTLMVFYLVAQYFKPKPIDWSRTYKNGDKIPHGTYILWERIKDLYPDANVETSEETVYQTLKNNREANSNYLIIAKDVKIDSLDYREMLKYMRRGNHIFIAAERINGFLGNTLHLDIEPDFQFEVETKTPVNFVNPSLQRSYGYYFDRSIAEHYFSKFDTARALVLGQKEGKLPNFLCYKFGKGALYLLPNPQLLTNYSLLKGDGLDYASKALSYLPKAKNLIWDLRWANNIPRQTSVLRVFFEYDQLRWAYYCSLLGLVVFVLFEVKRRQRVIPVIERPKNSSVEFAKVVGRVYYQQRDNRDIAEKKVVYLLEYLRTKYRLKTSKIDQEFKQALIGTSAASEEVVEAMFIAIAYLNAGTRVSDEELVSLNKTIENFYKQDR